MQQHGLPGQNNIIIGLKKIGREFIGVTNVALSVGLDNGKNRFSVDWASYLNDGQCKGNHILPRCGKCFRQHLVRKSEVIQLLQKTIQSLQEEELQQDNTAVCWMDMPTIMDANSIFMYDNAPIHRARMVVQQRQDQALEIMVWLPYSPNLNPIEKFWFLLKEAMYKAYPELLTIQGNGVLEALITAAQEAWDSIGENVLNKLSDTMPHRVQVVLDANGQYKKQQNFYRSVDTCILYYCMNFVA